MSNSKEILIRNAADSDRDAVAAVLLEAYGQYAAELPEPFWAEYRRSILDSVHGTAPYARIVAEIDNRIVGSVLLFLSSEEAYGRPELGIHSPIIRLLGVSPSVRGRGIAVLLIREAARRAIALGAATLNLHTSDMMASAIKLYERLGFKRAYETDIMNGNTLVKGYCLDLGAFAVPHALQTLSIRFKPLDEKAP
ncbi:GNAT family N-acetyltransferase [Paenibacillus jilunlii]|uniref:GCN5 family acetyltransferase n=1 Tax=Paenibacillus jilunlii TaxID=682956 RepID=A0A1G9LRY8_9BACL|nr:GNAT family N-acetyltransferase [Paenibacillus jilunlii]KWX72388.1 GCN5 family acetyltransferase [Paenibacillus jilunlii]SDL64708.1 Ribosomal protein S18 acetylase RimI [Paenibacillus jilunlii]